MRKVSLFIATFFLFVPFLKGQVKQVDTKSSSITWLGKKVTGEHTGHISFKSGSLEWKNNKLVGGEFTVDMRSITCTDIDNKDYNAKLVGHLKSDDFFGVDKHPTSHLKITKVSGNDSKYNVKGELSIKGKTHPVAFDVKKEGHTFTGKLVVDRTKYDVRYGSGKFFENLGDKMIYDDFELNFKVNTIK